MRAMPTFRRATALFVTMLTVSLVGFLLLRAANTVRARVDTHELTQARHQASYAAEAAAAVMENQLVEIAASNNIEMLATFGNVDLGAFDLNGDGDSLDPGEDQVFAWYGDDIYFGGCRVRYRVEPVVVANSDSFTVNPAPDPSQVPPSTTVIDSISRDLRNNFDYYNFRIVTEAYYLSDRNNENATPWDRSDDAGESERVAVAQSSRVVQLRLNTLFKYALFYAAEKEEGDIEFHNGPDMNVAGSIHSNGSIYFAGDNGVYHSGDNGRVTAGSATRNVSVVGVDGIYRMMKFPMYRAFAVGGIASDDPYFVPLPGENESTEGGYVSNWTMSGTSNVNGGPQSPSDTPADTYTINGIAMQPKLNDSRRGDVMQATWGPLVRDRRRGASVVKTLANIKELGGRPFEAQKPVIDALDKEVHLFVRDPTNGDFTLTLLPNLEEQPAGYYYDPWNTDGDPDNDYNFVTEPPGTSVVADPETYVNDTVRDGRPLAAHNVLGKFGDAPEVGGRARLLYYSVDPATITQSMKSAPPYSGAYNEAGAGQIPGLPTYIQTQDTGYPEVSAGSLPLFRQVDQNGDALFADVTLEDVTDPLANPHDIGRSWYGLSREEQYAKSIHAVGGNEFADRRLDRDGDGDESDGFRRNESMGYYAERAIYGGHQQDPGVAIFIRERPAQIPSLAGAAPDPSDPTYVRATGGFTSAVGRTLLYWPLDEGSGAEAGDAGGLNHDGEIDGAAWSTGGYTGTDNALNFDGGDNRSVEDVDAGDYLNGLDAFTIAMWVNPSDDEHDRGLFTTAEPDNNDNVLSLRFDQDGEGGADDCLRAILRTTEGTFAAETGDNTQWTGGYQHLTMTWVSGGGIQLFVNGYPMPLSFQTDPEIGGTVRGIQTLLVGLGPQDGNSSWRGLIDDVRIYDFVVDSADIQQKIMLGQHPQAIVPQTGYLGSPTAITASGITRIEAEHYDLGGSGVAFSDTDGINTGLLGVRSDGTDRDIVVGGSGYAVGSADEDGDWLEYTVNVAETGRYSITVSAASTGGSFRLFAGNTDLTGPVAVATGSTATFADFTSTDVGLGQGIHRLKLLVEGVDPTAFAVDALEFTRTADAKTFGEATVDYLQGQYQVYFGTQEGNAGTIRDITRQFFGYRANRATEPEGLIAYESWVRNRRETGFMGARFDVDNDPDHAIDLDDFKCNWLTIDLGQAMDFVKTTRLVDIDPTVSLGSTEVLADRFNGLVYVSRTRRSAHEIDPSAYHGIVEQYERNAANTMTLLPHGYHPIWNPDWARPKDRQFFNVNWDHTDYLPPAHRFDESSNAAAMAQVRSGNGPDCTFQNALRIKGGEALNWGGQFIGDNFNRVRGTTVICQNAVFLQGDFNVTMYDANVPPAARSYFSLNTDNDNFITEAEIEANAGDFELPPAAIFCDGLNVLSNSWDDANETDFSGTLQRAGDTWYNASVVINNVPTYYYGTETTLSSSTPVVPSGGPHNVIRYLEDWDSRWYHVKGSVVVMGVSKYSLAEAGWDASSRTSNERYYSPPQRDIQFNTDLFTRPGQPPFTPFGVTVIRTVQTINVRDQ
jgi:hypothetical protein